MQRAFGDRAASCTTAGRRAVNEDAVLLAQFAPGTELIAVADGMGGHAAGDVASNRALQVLHSAIASGDDLPTAVRLANAAVHDEALTRPECRGMGTTLVAALQQDGRYTVANVGDSRAYRVDDMGIRQLTEDNSFIAEAVRSGKLTAEEAEQSLWRNAVTRCLGAEPELEVDTYGPFEAVDPHTLLLCTDGVYRAISPEAMRRYVIEASDAASAVHAITQAAFEAGSEDNISVALISFEAAPRPVDLKRSPPAMVLPPARVRRKHRKLPDGWTLVRGAVILVGTLLTIVYIARTLS